jgi:hypothetical protein
MKHRRTAWTACIVAITSLGLGGIIAEGCGGDDSSGSPTGAAGSGGSTSTSTTGTGGSTTTTGTGGTGGSGGTSTGTGGTGGSTSKDSGSDAPADGPDYGALCRGAAPDSGDSCSDKCICDQCAKEAVTCFSNPACRDLLDCSNAMGCTDAVCAASKCMGQFQEAGAAGVLAAKAFGDCYLPKCGAQCSGDAASDAPKGDVTTNDAPKGDVTTSDVTTSTEGGSSEAGGD